MNLGVLVLMTGLVLSSQQDGAAESGQLGEMTNGPVDELSALHLNGNVESFAPAVKKVAPAVVQIVTAPKLESLPDLTGGLENPLSRYSLRQVPGSSSGRLVLSGLGSGVIVSEDGYILTNSHLVTDPREVEVTLQDGRQFKAKVIGLDPKSDIAVLKIDAQHLPTVPLAESRKVRVGDPVLAFGYPFGVGQTVTHGIVSATDRDGVGIEDYESFIQTDAPINPGNSGGALVDVTGNLIGITTAILSSTGGNLGIGFAVSSDLARKVMTDLIKYGYVVRGYLGVETQGLTPELAKEFKLHGGTGVLVGDVVPGGSAEKAGLEVGDVITRFDGKEVRDTRQLKLSLAEAKPGQTVPVEVLRNGSAMPLRVTVDQASNEDLLAKAERTVYEQDPDELRGVIIGELNSELRRQLKIPRNVKGALVFGVNPFSSAAEAGLRPGDVIESINRQEVGNAGEASRLTKAARNERMLLRVWSKGSSHFLLVE
ncbi:MAG TPA: Do family serine endopeptidase [Candidatus Binatia bacterium]|nr:Do family serine endopeptidase [Candidatus Binatia bacterium]